MEKNIENNVQLKEHLDKIKYRTNYKINETPRYRPIMDDGEEFDSIPVLTNEAGEQEDAPIPGGGRDVREPSNDQPITTDAPIPKFDDKSKQSFSNEEPNQNDDANPENVGDLDKEVDLVQNEIIKHNIEAMKNIHNMLQSLDNSVKELNKKVESLNKEVEEVREPSNVEKLINKKSVSYPYYFNLNDLWDGNWFSYNRNKEKSGWIRELPDGTFVADFDDLPQVSNIDIQNSYNEMI